MKEVEILVEAFDNKETILNTLKTFSFKGEKETIDTYYFDPLRPQFQVQGNLFPKERFRLRTKQGKNYITYKKDHFDESGIRIYSDEHETEIKDLEVAKNIINHLNFEELITIHNIKHTFETPAYEIVFEEVKDLGYFLEVERLTITDDEDISTVKKEIQTFINDLHLHVSKELTMGKPELMLKKFF